MSKAKKLIDFMIDEFRLDSSIFSYDLSKLRIVEKDIKLIYYEKNNLNYSSFKSYRYKQKEIEHWISIELFFDYLNCSYIIQELNKFLISNSEVSIDISNIENSVSNNKPYDICYLDNDLSYLVIRFTISECFISIAQKYH